MKNYRNNADKNFYSRKRLIADLKNESWNEKSIQNYCKFIPEILTKEEYQFHYQAFLDCIMMGGEKALENIGNNPPVDSLNDQDQVILKHLKKRFKYNYLKCG